MHTIVRNRILNQLRTFEQQERLREHLLSQAVDYSNDTKQEILFNDLRRLIAQALQLLTPRQREIFEMSRERQLSHKEIAEQLGISVYTVQESISTSLKILREYLRKNAVISVDAILLLVCLNVL